MTTATKTTLPRRLPAVLGMVAALVSVLLVADTGGVTTGLTLLLLGLVVLVAGLHYRQQSPVGYVVAAIGGVIAVTGFVLPLRHSLPTQLLFELYAGMIGLGLYALGIGALKRGLERRFVTAGVAFLFAGVLVTGVFQGTEPKMMLAATVACVVAWDAGEQAINLGEHVGTASTSWSAALTHVAGTTLVGLGAIVVTLAVHSLDVTGLPLSALLALLTAALLALAALYH